VNTDSVPPQPFKNRKAGLLIFGILTIIGGCVCALFALLAAVAPMLAAKASNSPPTSPNVLPAVVMYCAMAIAFVWLGVGSIMARRWARALLAVISWTFVVFGICALVFLVMMAPQFKQTMAAAQPPNQPPLSDSMQTGMIVGMFCFFGLFGVVGPLIWALFYSGRNVKATCEVLDPVPRWTDRCPLPVLAISIWLLFGAVTMVGMAAFYPVATFFGLLISGNMARGYHICLGLIWLYAAWALYRLDRRGWWVIFVAMTASILSALITFSRHDVAEIYALLHYPAQQVAMIQKFGFGSHTMLWSTILWMAPMVAYLLYIRRFFTRPANPAQVTG
jgi:hypothetical protein